MNEIFFVILALHNFLYCLLYRSTTTIAYHTPIREISSITGNLFEFFEHTMRPQSADISVLIHMKRHTHRHNNICAFTTPIERWNMGNVNTIHIYARRHCHTPHTIIYPQHMNVNTVMSLWCRRIRSSDYSYIYTIRNRIVSIPYAHIVEICGKSKVRLCDEIMTSETQPQTFVLVQAHVIATTRQPQMLSLEFLVNKYSTHYSKS